MARGRLAVGALLLVVAAGAAGAGVRLNQVHDYGWEWTLFPSAAPPRIEFDGRSYNRGGEREDPLSDGEVASGETMGGGTIYAEPDQETPVIIYVSDDEHLWTYGLMGGP